MTIDFTCTNILQYDAENNRYEQCGTLLSSPAHESGNRMQCPACQQWVEIPVASTVHPQSVCKKSDSNAGDASQTEDLANEEIQVTSNMLLVDAGVETAVDAIPLTDSMSQFDNEFAQNDGTSFAGAAAGLQFDAFDLSKRCPRCEGAVDKHGRCTQCKQGHEPVVLPEEVPLKHFETQSAGFSYWMHRWMSENITITQLVTAFTVLMALAGVGYGIAGFMIGGPVMMVMLIGASPFVVAYVYTTQYWIKMNTKPVVPLQWWQQIPWDFFLQSARSSGWSRKPKLVLDCRNQNLMDHQIADLPALGKIAVLDLEGNQLTDEGLLQLYQFRNIKCLVLKNNRVTPEGVFRIQQYNRRMWIWS